MAGVQGMAVTAGGLPQSANKEKGAFTWHDAAEAGSADFFFDEYVVLDPDSASGGGGGGGFGHFGGTSGPPASPLLSPSGQMLPPPGGAQGQFPAGNDSSNDSNIAGSSGSPIRQPGEHHQAHPHHPATVNMAALSNHQIDVDGLPYGSFGEAPGAGGSFSDSELLNFGELRMGSPRIQMPPLSASEPASPPSKATSLRKASRLGKFCAKVRNKATALQGKRAEVKPEPEREPEASLGVPVMSTAQLEPAKTTSARPRPQGLHISKAQLPSSPPLTSGMPSEAQQAVAGSEASAVNGFLDDPFFTSSHFVPPPLQLNGSAMPQTPMSTTPHMDGDWHMPMAAADGGKAMWTAYFGHTGDANTMWDTTSPDAMDTDPPPMSYHAAANARNTSANYTIHLLQQQPNFQYPPPPGTENTTTTTVNPTGLLLHMPQPRGIPSAMLQANDNTTASVSSHRPTRADAPQQQQQHRRPKPRAPSSGARHHHHGHHQYGGGPAGISPRKGGKGRAVSGSGSASRIASVSPSPKMMPAATISSSAAAAAAASAMSGGGGGSGRAMLHRRSASMQTLTQPVSADGAGGGAISKRRSWTGRRTSSSGGSSSTSLHHQYNLAVAAAAAAAVGVGVGAGGGGGSPGALPSRRRTNTGTGNGTGTGTSSRPVSGGLLCSSSTSTFPPSHHYTTNNGHSHHHNSHPHPYVHNPHNNNTHPPYNPLHSNTITNPPKHPPTTTTISGTASAGGGTGGFVNYTPSDHTLLMTGVAPSGSSKTKARREREAAERQRELLARMFHATGGDVSKLGELEMEMEIGGLTGGRGGPGSGLAGSAGFGGGRGLMGMGRRGDSNGSMWGWMGMGGGGGGGGR